MTKAELLAQIAMKPIPFTVGSHSVLLRPLRYRERLELMTWNRNHKDEPGANQTLQVKLVGLGLCDDAGQPLLTEDEVGDLEATLVDDLATEIGRKSGLYEDKPAAASGAKPAETASGKAQPADGESASPATIPPATIPS